MLLLENKERRKGGDHKNHSEMVEGWKGARTAGFREVARWNLCMISGGSNKEGEGLGRAALSASSASGIIQAMLSYKITSFLEGQ